MPFRSGRVSYSRFIVEGEGPTNAEAVIEQLAEYRFREDDIGAGEDVEKGWITGEHIFDTQFDYAKNGFGSVVLFAMRMDTQKVPAEVKQAYRAMNEQSIAAQNPSGFASKRQKREAGDLADRQVHDDLASGKYRRPKMIPVLWDLHAKQLYCGGSGTAVLEHLASLFRETFELTIEPMTAGTLAGQRLSAKGKSRDYEDIRPSPFTPPPPQATADHDDADGPQDISIPRVPWTFTGTDAKDFLGNEFLLWLWHIAEAEEGLLPIQTELHGKREAAIVIDKSLEMDCAWGVLGKQTLRGDGPTRLTEAGEALVHGKWPRKANLILSDGEFQWEFSLQSDKWQVGSAALPEIAEVNSPRELIEERLRLTRLLSDTIDGMFDAFLAQRTGDGWRSHRETISKWIDGRLKRNR